MIRMSCRLLLFAFLIFYEGVHSKRGGGTSGGRGSSASRSSSSYSSRGSSGGSYGGSRHTYSSSYGGGSYSYGGGGYGDSSSDSYREKPKYVEHPTVTKIKDILFPGDCRKPSEDIFILEEYAHLRERYPKDGEEESIKDMFNGVHRWLDSMKNGELSVDFDDKESMRKAQKRLRILNQADEEEVIVKDEKRPILVGSVSYFWGVNSLSQSNDTDFIEFSPVNDASIITLCNISSMASCKKSIAEVVLLGKEKKSNGGDVNVIVKTSNGTKIEQLAWFCPPSEKCCEWDCCATEKAKSEH